ncbi:TPA: hypothetical protein N0F65_012489 [Lagenidium giganteum]|uniref:DNA replication ATP-dependent helicase/nuclease n=1 Tax=Lagenidium giganteum TaxID=4803 RepID=A0AAV2YRI4_9STRA|nr:TPA: hypothetical protein N0F65_012489 [Lagenidium giganteum]
MKTPRGRKRLRMEATTPSKDAAAAHGGACAPEARIVWKDSPVEKQIRVSGTSKLSVQREMHGFVGRMQRASTQSTTPEQERRPSGKAKYLSRTKAPSSDISHHKIDPRVQAPAESTRRSSTGGVPQSHQRATNDADNDPEITRHLVFSPTSDRKHTPPPRHRGAPRHHAVSTSPRVPAPPFRASQDELSILDRLEERYAGAEGNKPTAGLEQQSTVRASVAAPVLATATTQSNGVAAVNSAPAAAAPTQPPRPPTVIDPVQVNTVPAQDDTEFDSPEPFTEESWQLLDQMEYQASQRIMQSQATQLASPPAIPPTQAQHAPAPSQPVVQVSQPERGILVSEDDEFKRLLVLEIDRDPTSRCQVLRLLDEREDLVDVSLKDDWYDTEIDVGDTVNVVFTAQDRASGLYSQTFDDRNQQSARNLHTQSRRWERIEIDNNRNAIVVHPDILVSPTSVTSSYDCSRRAVLKETLSVTKPTHPKAFLGTLKHNLFEKALLERRYDLQFLSEEARRIVSSNVLGLVECGVSDEMAIAELDNVASDMAKWIHDIFSSGVQLNLPPGSGDPDNVRVDQIFATEEMMWSIKWGLKGATDVSVQGVIRHSNQASTNNTKCVIPVELKTGSKVYAGIEHQGQVILYTLLLNERYRQQSQDGLLLYVPGIETNRIQAMASHIRGLIKVRNRFASSIARVKAIGGATMQELPPMLRRRRDCERCFQQSECLLHHAAVENGSPESSGLDDLFQHKMGHLNDVDLAYFRHWNELIEHEQHHAEKNVRALWLQVGWKREEQHDGACVAGLLLVSDEPSEAESGSSKRLLCFQRDRARAKLVFPNGAPLLEQKFRSDERVIISVESVDGKKMIAHVTRGRVVVVEKARLVVEVHQPIPAIVMSGKSTVGSQFLWRLDRDTVVSGLKRAKENLVRLFVGVPPELTNPHQHHAIARTEILSAIAAVSASQVGPNGPVESNVGDVRRRQLVVHLTRPRFKSCRLNDLLMQKLQSQHPHDSKRVMAQQLIQEFQRLNLDQQRAVQKVINSLDYALVLGMPGTGKTSTISYVVRVLLFMGYSVLVTSYTHSAVDNLLLKLLSHHPQMLRLASKNQVHPLLADHTLDALIARKQFKTRELQDVLERVQLVGCTCLSINSHVMFTKRRFDFCIVDEASQITQPVVLGALRCADTFVLVGDHYQLPPLVANTHARQGGMDVSLFRRLSEAHPEAMTQLSYQYRMNQHVMLLANRLVYGGKLKCGSFGVASNQLKIRNRSSFASLSRQLQLSWPMNVVWNDQGVVFLDVDRIENGTESLGTISASGRKRLENLVEADIVAGLVVILLLGGVPEEEVAVVSPFRSQVALITQRLLVLPYFQGRGSLGRVEVSTIDKYQGKDKDVVVVSFVRCNSEKRVGELLTDWRRINVALTRAKQKLLLVGSKQTLSGGSAVLSELLTVIDEQRWECALPSNAMHELQQLLSKLEHAQTYREPEREDDITVRHDAPDISVYRPSEGHNDIESLVPGIRAVQTRPMPRAGGSKPITRNIIDESRS